MVTVPCRCVLTVRTAWDNVSDDINSTVEKFARRTRRTDSDWLHAVRDCPGSPVRYCPGAPPGGVRRGQIMPPFTLTCAHCTCLWTAAHSGRPFVAQFPAGYVPALSLGEGLTGAIAAGLTWIQTARGDGQLAFSIATYFYILAGLMACSGIAFGMLLRRRHGRTNSKRGSNSGGGGGSRGEYSAVPTSTAGPAATTARVRGYSSVAEPPDDALDVSLLADCGDGGGGVATEYADVDSSTCNANTAIDQDGWYAGITSSGSEYSNGAVGPVCRTGINSDVESAGLPNLKRTANVDANVKGVLNCSSRGAPAWSRTDAKTLLWMLGVLSLVQNGKCRRQTALPCLALPCLALPALTVYSQLTVLSAKCQQNLQPILCVDCLAGETAPACACPANPNTLRLFCGLTSTNKHMHTHMRTHTHAHAHTHAHLRVGIRPAILSYACLPYGNTVYHAVQTAVLCVDPIGQCDDGCAHRPTCVPEWLSAHLNGRVPILLFVPIADVFANFVSMTPSGAVAAFFYQPSRGMFVCLSVVWVLSAGYLLLVAGMSPHPPLSETSAVVGGGALVAFVAVSGSMALALAKTAAIVRLKMTAASWGVEEGDETISSSSSSSSDDGEGRASNRDDSEAEQLLFYQGAAMQLGSFIGAIVMFVLVNVVHAFQPMPNGTNVTPPVIPPHVAYNGSFRYT